MKNYFLLSIIICSLSLTACKSLNKAVDTAHNSKNSLDWQGVYTGVVPCVKCGGLQTVLRLDSNNMYELQTTYLNKKGSPDIKKGIFSWDKNGGKITLNNLDRKLYPVFYTVGENQLTQLDSKGDLITTELANKYVLQKETNPIIEKYWKLVELNGKPVSPVAEGQREPYLTLKVLNKGVIGNGGCNGFGATYELLPGNRIRFFQILSTMMACPNLNDEQELFKVLETADNYSYYNDTMTLNKAKMAPLARFVAVYF